jgi:putative two-component system response regulator
MNTFASSEGAPMNDIATNGLPPTSFAETGIHPAVSVPPQSGNPLPAGGAPDKSLVMIVDDEPINVKILQKHLKVAGYSRFFTTSDATTVLDRLRKNPPDVLLLDVMMPDINGLDLLEEIRNDASLGYFPVLILTASDSDETRVRALNLGATDFLNKPVNPSEIVARVRNALLVKAHHDHLKSYSQELEDQVRRRTAELAASRLELIHCLARAAESRDNETGHHVMRVGCYAGLIARKLGLDPDLVELIEHAAPLHDLGKIGIPDSILLKPGKLAPDEYEIMRKHAVFGKRTFEPMTNDEWRTFKSHTVLGEMIMEADGSPVIRMAAKIALTHHEKWDGSGYPLGLAGEEIPLPGRITAVADVFDALSSSRPYKPAWPLDRCFKAIQDGRGTHFDPVVLDAFIAGREEIVRIRMKFADAE